MGPQPQSTKEVSHIAIPRNLELYSNHATIYQFLPTIPGTTYELSFFIGAALSPSPTINVRLDGSVPILNQVLTADAPSTNIAWKPESFIFVADSLLTKLSFHDISSFDDNVSFVDSVSVNAVPEPRSIFVWSLLVLLVVGGAAQLPAANSDGLAICHPRSQRRAAAFFAHRGNQVDMGR